MFTKKWKNVSLSVMLMTKNEEKFLPTSLENLKFIASEIIIIDTGSTDNTKQIAEKMGAKVYQFKWNDHFGEVKEFGRKLCTSEWIWVYDADERIEAKNINKIYKLMQDTRYDAYNFAQKNVYPDWFSKTYLKAFYPNYHIVLFRNLPNLKYISRVHEGVHGLNPNRIGKGTFDTIHWAFRGDRQKNEIKKHEYYLWLSNKDKESGKFDKNALDFQLDESVYNTPVQQKRIQWVLKTIEKQHSTILDVGSGDGYITNLLRQNEHNVFSLEMSQIRIQRHFRRLGKEKLIQGNACYLPFKDNSFDYVYIGETLEHIINPGQVLQEAFRIAKHKVLFDLPRVRGGYNIDPHHIWGIECEDFDNNMFGIEFIKIRDKIGEKILE